MRFEEVIQRFKETIIEAPGHRDDGLTIADAVPHFATTRIWRATHGSYSWSIVFEPGVPSWTEAQKVAHVGYSASYRRLEHRDSSRTIYVDGGPWRSFTEAEAACKRIWRQIRAAN